MTPQLRVSTGFNIPFSGDALIQNGYSFRLKNGATEIDALANGANNGGATQFSVGSFKYFNAGSNPSGGTVSFQGNGSKFFTTPVADSSQAISVQTQGGAGTLKVQQTAKTSNQTLANKLAGLTTTQYVIIGGAVTVGVLLLVFLRR